MNRVYITGTGAVSPAGWTVAALDAALQAGTPLPTQPMPRHGWPRPFLVRQVPAPQPRPAILAHPRLRRASPISHFALSAALEALGPWPPAGEFRPRLGIVMGVHAACIRYSERFYAEVRQNPATASPMLFPETVINAPASHLATCIGGAPLTYTLVGDQTVFVEALVVGATWLAQDRADVVLVVGAEESDWLVADAIDLSAPTSVASEGAGALRLASEPAAEDAIELTAVTSAWSYAGLAKRDQAVEAMRRELPAAAAADLLCDSRRGVPRADRAEATVWQGWAGDRISPKTVLGEGLAAATAWQFVAAHAWLRRHPGRAATLSVVGSNAAALGARLTSLRATMVDADQARSPGG